MLLSTSLNTNNLFTPRNTKITPEQPPRPLIPRNMSTGRGGAGNISTAPANGSAQKDVTELVTPTIKQATYTTGRGGQGNMVANDQSKPEIARIAQNLDAPLHHYKEISGTHHWGRGGEGNMMTIGQQQQKKPENPATANLARPDGPQKRTSSFTGALDAAREALFGKKKDGEKEAEKRQDSSAVADD